ncbi:MAG: DUF3516 domain-containing protein [Acidimicrobiales bacterium]
MLRPPVDAGPDEILETFVDHVTDQGLELYPAQEEAILEILAGNNVIVNTPTGSGKSLVGAAAHLAALATGRRSYYTAPIKALVSEKFFSLCRDFGSDNVGMVTGDAAVNGDAPIICCTAEILANQALRDGRRADVDVVVADEFHFYADPQRGWAWQVPLLELPHCQFVLMSATLGDTTRFETGLTDLTGRPTVVVSSATRPVPLTFEYRETPIHETIAEALAEDRAPIYVVHFSQREATEAAQAYTSLDAISREEKEQVREAVGGFRFDSAIGKDLRRFVGLGVGVHHAGLLPKYRLLVEKLAQQGLLKVICGTDTLGVGVNVPIRTVLFTQLCKYDGTGTRLLTNREFAQIAGRAGRRGFDDVGYVEAQAPAHVVENKRAEEKAADDPKKKRKLVKSRPPERGFVPWNEDTFTKLVDGAPETLTSSFSVSHQMLMHLLDRPGDGCAAVRRILKENHDPPKLQRTHKRRAISIYRSLREAGVVTELDEPDELGRRVRVTIDLQDDFALHQPLSLFAVEAIETLEPVEPDYALDVLSVIESVLENPGVILAAQIDRRRTALLQELKARGVEYEERMERLAEVRHPEPLADFLQPAFGVFRSHHPWVGDERVKPKSIVREIYETGWSFRDFVVHYGLKRSEGVVLRYLSDAFRALRQNVPEPARTDDVVDLTEWLGEVVRQVDSSLLDEWERLTAIDDAAAAGADDLPGVIADAPDLGGDRPDVTANRRAFAVMVRNEVFRWVQLLARREHETLAEVPGDGERWTAEEIENAIADYWTVHDRIGLDRDARGPELFEFGVDGDPDVVRQTIADPERWQDWKVVGRVDREASREEGRAVVLLSDIGDLGVEGRLR